MHFGFQGNTAGGRLILFILCLLYVGESPAGESQSISEANNNSAQLDKWPEILAVGVLTPKERWPELQLACESIRFSSLFAAADVSRLNLLMSKKGDQSVNRATYIKPESE